MNISNFQLTIFKICIFKIYYGNYKLRLGCIQLNFIKAAPQQTNSTSYNRNRPEMTLTSGQSLLLIPPSRWQHITMRLMNPTALWVPTYFTKCFHFTGSMPHYFNVAYTKAQCCGRILITAFVRPFLAAYLITGWNRLILLTFCHAKLTYSQ